jgi:hypothetical protein
MNEHIYTEFTSSRTLYWVREGNKVKVKKRNRAETRVNFTQINKPQDQLNKLVKAKNKIPFASIIFPIFLPQH